MSRAQSPRPWTLVLVAALTVVATGCDGSGSPGAQPAVPSSATASATPSAAASESYGGYPSFLPPSTVDGGFEHRVVNASAARPALATQGDTVRVHIGDDTVLATVTGPAVPVAGQQYQAPASPATWQVTLTDASARMSLDPATFQAIDESGSVYDLQAQGDVPSSIGPGQDATFALYSPGIATGEGRLRWIPVGHLAPVEWDFVVETD